MYVKIVTCVCNMATDDFIFDKGIMERVLKAEQKASEIMTKLIYEDLMKPMSVIDIGCGPGHFANEFKKLGCERVDALDIAPISRQFLNPDITFIQHDLRTPYITNDKYDLVICFEVIEHIEEEFENILCNNIAKCVDGILVISVAPIGQESPGHVNLKKATYWIKKFTDKGLIYRHDIKAKWFWNLHNQKDNIPYYFINNILVFTTPEVYDGNIKWVKNA